MWNVGLVEQIGSFERIIRVYDEVL
jgi:hypothetical protein